MLSEEQKLLLPQLVRDNKTVVLAPFSSKVTKKPQAWETIRTQLNSVGTNIGMKWNDLFNVEDVGSVCTIFRARGSC